MAGFLLGEDSRLKAAVIGFLPEYLAEKPVQFQWVPYEVGMRLTNPGDFLQALQMTGVSLLANIAHGSGALTFKFTKL